MFEANCSQQMGQCKWQRKNGSHVFMKRSLSLVLKCTCNLVEELTNTCNSKDGLYYTWLAMEGQGLKNKPFWKHSLDHVEKYCVFCICWVFLVLLQLIMVLGSFKRSRKMAKSH